MYLWKLKTGQKGEKRKKKKENVSVQIEDLPLYLTLYSWHADLAFWSGGEMPSSLTWANKKLIVSCICFLVEFRELTDAELVRHRTWYWQKLKKKKKQSNLIISSLSHECQSQQPSKKGRNKWRRTTIPLVIYTAVWSDFEWCSKDALAPPQKYWIIITRGNEKNNLYF